MIKECKYYNVEIDNGTYRTYLKVECPKPDCTIDKTGLCDIVLKDERAGVKLVSLYQLTEEGK